MKSFHSDDATGEPRTPATQRAHERRLVQRPIVRKHPEWEEREIDPTGHVKVAVGFLLPLLLLLAWGAFAS